MDIEEIIALIPLLLEGKATGAQEREICRWLGEQEENPEIYKRLSTTYYKLHFAHQWKNIDVVLAITKAKVRIRQRNRIRKLGAWFSGVAALFLIGWCIHLFMLQDNSAVLEILAKTEVKSGEKKALLTLADGSQVELKAENRLDIDLGGVRAVEDSMTGLVYQLKDTVVKTLELHRLSVPRAGEYIMILSDGTKVWLNAETEIRYPVIFGAEKREVFITGEAFFEVVRDTTRPFIVRTPHTQTTVLGTAFNVMAYEGELRTEITLVSGRVNVEAGGSKCHITPGHQVGVDNASLSMEDREVNTTFYSSWKEGLFDFDQMTLDQLCVQLSRWYDVDFFFANPTAAKKRFTGAIKRNNTLRFMLDFVEKTSNVRFEVSGKTVSVYNQ